MNWNWDWKRSNLFCEWSTPAVTSESGPGLSSTYRVGQPSVCTDTGRNKTEKTEKTTETTVSVFAYSSDWACGTCLVQR